MPKTYSYGKPFRDKRGLTEPQQVFVDNCLELGPVGAARMAYPDSTPESQVVMASQNIHNPEVVLSLSKEADKRGLKLSDGIDAVKRGLKDKDKYLKAAELTLKIHGHLQDNKTIMPVPVSKEHYWELCQQFFKAKSGSSQDKP